MPKKGRLEVQKNEPEKEFGKLVVLSETLFGILLFRLVLSICQWGSLADGMSFLGDNLASLNLALSGKAKGKLNHLARELALQIARRDLQFSVGRQA